MTDERLLRRVDLLLAMVAGWFVLTLVVASFALMVVDLAIGLLALTTVVLFIGVATLSYVRSSASLSDRHVDVR